MILAAHLTGGVAVSPPRSDDQRGAPKERISRSSSAYDSFVRLLVRVTAGFITGSISQLGIITPLMLIFNAEEGVKIVEYRSF